MDRKSIIDIVKAFKDRAYNSYKPKEVYLYGSYAKGTANKDSDIDVAFVYDNYNSDNYLEESANLWGLSHEIDIRIEPVIVDKDDDVSGFLSDIKSHGILID